MKDVSDLYIKNDLGDYADTDIREPSEYKRLSYLEAILPDEAVIKSYSTGGYQGMMGFVIWLDDYIWLIKEAYGSCGYCDGFIDSHKLSYAESMCRNAYCFENEAYAVAFLEEKSGERTYRWGKIGPKMKDMITE